MAIEIKVVIPSHKRANRVKTLDHVANAIVCVPQAQERIYREANPDAEIIVHPDSVIGLAPKRQWIYDKFKNVFMLDDDIIDVKRLYADESNEGRVDPETAWHVIQHAGNLAHLMGVYLFGFNKAPMPLGYNEFEPFQLSGHITGCAFGMLEGSKMKFRTDIVAVEDFYISGINAYYHRKCFLDLRYNFTQEKTFVNVGGLSDFRTEETEKKDTLLLRQLFGECVQVKKENLGLAKNKNKYGRTFKTPF
jgi:hypothetical protein